MKIFFVEQGRIQQYVEELSAQMIVELLSGLGVEVAAGESENLFGNDKGDEEDGFLPEISAFASDGDIDHPFGLQYECQTADYAYDTQQGDCDPTDTYAAGPAGCPAEEGLYGV